jgi:WD40 repeat protein
MIARPVHREAKTSAKGVNTMPPTPGYPKPPTALFSPGGSNNESVASSNVYVTVSEDGTIQLFSLPNQGFKVKGNLQMTFKGPSVTDIAFSPDGRFLTWGRGDGSVSLYNIQENDLVIVVPPTETSQSCG